MGVGDAFVDEHVLGGADGLPLAALEAWVFGAQLDEALVVGEHGVGVELLGIDVDFFEVVLDG